MKSRKELQNEIDNLSKIRIKRKMAEINFDEEISIPDLIKSLQKYNSDKYMLIPEYFYNGYQYWIYVFGEESDEAFATRKLKLEKDLEELDKENTNRKIELEKLIALYEE